MSISYDAILRRAEKVVKRLEGRSSASKIHIVTIDDCIEKLSGLVVILSPNKPDCKPPPKPIIKNQSSEPHSLPAKTSQIL
jgi:hypothetical protein